MYLYYTACTQRLTSTSSTASSAGRRPADGNVRYVEVDRELIGTPCGALDTHQQLVLIFCMRSQHLTADAFG